MRKRTRSILEELNSIHMPRHSDAFIQSTGLNIIESAINLIDKIHETYDYEEAVDLERRLINSIRAGDGKKFRLGVNRITEGKKNDTK